MEIRNIAIIAHVDHGKTTLTDAILAQTGAGKEGVSMDSNELEKERGITIYAKNTSVFYKGTKINILDTPGHADFGSEVERVLRSIDSVLLVVDAAEGPMPQTKFVLKKSLELGLKPILILNKIDKPAANVELAQEAVYELFLNLGATDEQLDFTTLYAIGRDGVAKRDMDDHAIDLSPILDTIIEKVEPVSGKDLAGKPLRAQVFNLAYDNFLGRMGIARIYEGTIKDRQEIFVKDADGKEFKGKITKLFTFEGLNRKEINESSAGDIVMLAGLPDIFIGQTLLDNEEGETLPAIAVDEPTVSFFMFVNDSPFAGRVGKYVTGRQIQDRLRKELEVNVGLRVDFGDGSRMKVYGRGELHLAVLIENMRREGFELAVSQPEVIFKEEDGKKLEPYEEVNVLVPEEFSGIVIEKLSKRRGVMTGMGQEHGEVRISFEVPTRGLLGYRNEFIIDTKGEGILTSIFSHFGLYAGEVQKTELGSMISMATGKTLAFSLANLQDRGTLYINPNIEVYEGMVIGNTSKGEDMTVNPTKGKQLTNMRASGSDENIRLAPPLDLTLEKALGFMNADEFLEVTPDAVRLRKQYLTENARVKNKR
ncbi:translational GTPase TypA [Candidatus Campbellbacteria bacterium CG22_combo_CG10-13_8_21_14_all_36_13]|uniref:50S ribosomal subunit assembly factor BipA n=1 Tax=Candidatus Campbellbacteria bacterium CG22_combo_CG10-13_8_21_14_all_36_13 TaxID=1974529 RepID=A0A2H0DYN5_9BACT|nr:MAG: translational GTPase TypA [Candidatus Campbellbacteria bacterium CG22_combo_CG10-13_8_21_14_all_36_13]